MNLPIKCLVDLSHHSELFFYLSNDTKHATYNNRSYSSSEADLDSSRSRGGNMVQVLSVKWGSDEIYDKMLKPDHYIPPYTHPYWSITCLSIYLRSFIKNCRSYRYIFMHWNIVVWAWWDARIYFRVGTGWGHPDQEELACRWRVDWFFLEHGMILNSTCLRLTACFIIL